jgi:UrcA family protein
MTMKHVLSTLAASVLLLPAVSHATSITLTENGRAAVIRYSDLNPATVSGAAELYKLIRASAAMVCGNADIRDLTQQAAIKACRAGAIARAVQQVGSDKLAILAKEHGARA